MRKGTFPIVNRDILVPNKMEHLKRMWNNQFLEEILRLKGADYQYLDRVRPLMQLKAKLGTKATGDELLQLKKQGVRMSSVDKAGAVQTQKDEVRRAFGASVDSKKDLADKVAVQEPEKLQLPSKPDVTGRGMPTRGGGAVNRFAGQPYDDEIKGFAEGNYFNLQDFKRARKGAGDESGVSAKPLFRPMIRESGLSGQQRSVLPPLRK